MRRAEAPARLCGALLLLVGSLALTACGTEDDAIPERAYPASSATPADSISTASPAAPMDTTPAGTPAPPASAADSLTPDTFAT